jgi:hypothetical protein
MDRCRYLALVLAMATIVGVPGCALVVPQVSTMPVLHNPFPQLARVAVVPFFNQSNESTVDGSEFAAAYFAELQGVPGFEVVPVGVVEEALIRERINLSNPGTAADELRRLGSALGVDAVVVGTVTDFSPYYPQRCGLRVEWYATNPGFHEIPAGYGLPWGTPDEEYIAESVTFEAELALAKAQLATQSPMCGTEPLAQPHSQPLPIPQVMASPHTTAPLPLAPAAERTGAPFGSEPAATDSIDATGGPDSEVEELPPPGDQSSPLAPAEGAVTPTSAQFNVIEPVASAGALPPHWPNPQGFCPPGPQAARPACIENPGPVITHTRIFRGNDPEFTSALAAYVDFRDDARFGGWRSYLERSDDFIRFCCHLHISQMLEARGGATETRVVQRWSDNR